MFDVGGVFDVVFFSLFVLLVVSFGRLLISLDCVSLVCVSSWMEGGVVVSVSASSVVVVDVVSVEVVVAAAVLVVAIEVAAGEFGMDVVGVGLGIVRGVCGTRAWLGRL